MNAMSAARKLNWPEINGGHVDTKSGHLRCSTGLPCTVKRPSAGSHKNQMFLLPWASRNDFSLSKPKNGHVS